MKLSKNFSVPHPAVEFIIVLKSPKPQTYIQPLIYIVLLHVHKFLLLLPSRPQMVFLNTLSDGVKEALSKQRSQQAVSQWKCSKQVSSVAC